MSHEALYCYSKYCAPKLTDFNVDLHIRLPVEDVRVDTVLVLLSKMLHNLESIGIETSAEEAT